VRHDERGRIGASGSFGIGHELWGGLLDLSVGLYRLKLLAGNSITNPWSLWVSDQK
jgi:hypothetical protein